MQTIYKTGKFQKATKARKGGGNGGVFDVDEGSKASPLLNCTRLWYPRPNRSESRGTPADLILEKVTFKLDYISGPAPFAKENYCTIAIYITQ